MNRSFPTSPRAAASPARTPLTTERIVAAALAMIDVGGVEALSMRKLASALGVDPMSIYHHVPNKQALLQGVYQQVLQELPIPRAGPGQWQDALRELARRFYALARRHPRVLPAIFASPYGTPREREIQGAIARILEDVGFEGGARGRLVRSIYTYASGLTGVAAHGVRVRPLFGVGAAPPVPSPAAESDADVEFSIDLMIAGIEALARGRGAR